MYVDAELNGGAVVSIIVFANVDIVDSVMGVVEIFVSFCRLKFRFSLCVCVLSVEILVDLVESSFLFKLFGLAL